MVEGLGSGRGLSAPAQSTLLGGRRRRARGKMEDFQASEEVTSGWAVRGRVAAEIRVWWGPAWEDAAPLLTATWPEADEPGWRFPAATPRLSRVGGARGPRRRRGARGLGGVHGGGRREDDITPPLPHCCRPQPGLWLGKEASCCGIYSNTGAQGQLPVTAVGVCCPDCPSAKYRPANRTYLCLGAAPCPSARRSLPLRPQLLGTFLFSLR